MADHNLDVFAEQLVRGVRDAAIRDCLVAVGPHGKSPSAKRWRAALESANMTAICDSVIPGCIDAAIFFLLDAIDNGNMRLLFLAPDGSTVDLQEEGGMSLAGFYIENDREGWRNRYSNYGVE